jgi:hypothetical protein
MGKRPLPETIDGAAVEPSGEPLALSGETWQTMIAVDEDDARIWEFSLTTGRILRTGSR